MLLNDGREIGTREARDVLDAETVRAVCPANWMVEAAQALLSYATGGAPLPAGHSFAVKVHDLHREIDQRLRVLQNMKRLVEGCVRKAANDPEAEDAFPGEFKVTAGSRRYTAGDNAELYLAAVGEGIDPGAFAAACPAMPLASFAELMGLSRQAALESYGHLFKEAVTAPQVRRRYE